MQEALLGFSRSGKSAQTQNGVAIIMAMLTLALAAGIAAAVLGHFGASLEQVSGRHDQDQARWLARGALDWARNVLSADRRQNNVDHLQEVWATKVPPTPVEEGEVSGEIAERSGLFNLNSLVNAEGAPNPTQVSAYQRLLAYVGFGNDAPHLAQAVLQRLTPYMPQETASGSGATAATPINSLEELLQLPGYEAGMIERLRPFVTALPDGTAPVNANTAPAEVLAALIEPLGLARAQTLLQQRERAWFTSPEDFNRRLKEVIGKDVSSSLSVSSRYFLITGRAKFGEASVRTEALLDRKTNWATIVWQRYL